MAIPTERPPIGSWQLSQFVRDNDTLHGFQARLFAILPDGVDRILFTYRQLDDEGDEVVNTGIIGNIDPVRFGYTDILDSTDPDYRFDTSYRVNMQFGNGEGNGPESVPQALLTPEGENPPPPEPQRPNAITAFTAEIVEATTATFQWADIEGATTYNAQYQSFGLWLTVPTLVSTQANHHYVQISPLLPFTEYTVRINAANSVGASAWFEHDFRTTMVVEPPPVVHLVPATAPVVTISPQGNGTTAIIRWTEPEADPAVEGYYWQAQSTNPSGDNREGTTTGRAITIGLLTPTKSYRARVRAYNSIGDGPYSAWKPWTQPDSSTNRWLNSFFFGGFLRGYR